MAARQPALRIMATTAWLVACAAPRQVTHVTPVSMTQPGDEDLGCSALIQQMKSNRAAADEFLEDHQKVQTANSAKMLAGVLFSPLIPILTADLSDKDKIMGRSLYDRNERLIFLARKKDCKES